MKAYNEGDLIRAVYKTGEYIGEVVSISPPRLLMKVKAVLKHPTQGDLHHPMQANGVMFHQRKALADGEKAWVPLDTVYFFEDELPDYRDSLKHALETEMKELASSDHIETKDWRDKAL